jgi:large subunit ribosomal protein L21
MQDYAIAEIAGRQFRIEEGGKVTVPRLKASAGDSITIEKLLLINCEGKLTLGVPYVDGAQASAKVLEHYRSKKVRVFKKKRRKGYKRTFGSHQHLTTLEIETVKA